MDGTQRNPTKSPNAWMALILSILLPGMGHLHAGSPGAGAVAYLGAVAIAIIGCLWTFRTFTGLIATVGLEAIWVFCIAADAMRRAKKQPDTPQRWHTRWTTLLPLALLANVFMTCGFPRYAAKCLRYRPFTFVSKSMQPTLQPGDRFIVDGFWYHTHSPQRQDLMVIEPPEDPRTLWMERCVAIEGDLVEFRDQVFYLNGKAQGEPPPAVHGMPGARIPEPVASEYTVPFRIPEGTVFCLGDNRCNSYDSRYWGPLRRESIRGKVIYVYLAKGPGHRDLATP